jgi:hypothetical protein
MSDLNVPEADGLGLPFGVLLVPARRDRVAAIRLGSTGEALQAGQHHPMMLSNQYVASTP